MSREPQEHTDPPIPEQPDLKPEVIEKLGSWLAEVYAPLEILPDAARKSHAELIAYMDRLVLLAGGTLTLTFSALALISGHLNHIGKNAAHPGFIVAECWLLVVVIVVGLIHTRLMIRVQKFRDVTTAMSLMGLKTKLKLMANFPKADFSKLPSLEDKASQETISVTEKVLSVCSYAVHIALIAAFVSLAVFIQSNIGLILTAAP
jgi:hypothetical protein